MSYQQIGPWGKRPTSLVPANVIEVIGDYPAPYSFQKVLGDEAKIRDLGKDIWNKVENVTGDQISELMSLFKTYKLKYQSKYICSDLPENLSLLNLPFSTRTRNVVSYNTDYFRTNKFLTYEKALKELPNFGIKSAIEFSCVVEYAVSNKDFFDSTAEINEQVEFNYEGWERIKNFYKRISAWALGERHLRDFSELLPLPNDDWPEEIKSSWKQLRILETQKLAGNLVELYSVPSLIEQFLAQMDERLDQVVIERIFSLEHTVTLNDIGESLGLTRERVRQFEKKAFAILEKFHGDSYSPVLRRAKKMRASLGSALPLESQVFQDTVDEFTADFLKDDRGKVFAQGLLPWLAGPYKNHSEWLLVDKFLPDSSIEELLRNRDERGLISFEVLREVFLKMEIKEEFHEQWIKHLKNFLKVDDGMIFISGSVLDKAESLIRYHNRPMTAEELIESVGSGSVRSVRDRLMNDERFWRINKNNEFVLAGTEGYDEYTKITDKILQELEQHGGFAPIEHLVKKITTNYYVKKASVIAYLNTPMFTIDNDGNVRRANFDETTIEVKDIRETLSCYRTVAGVWCFRVELNSNHFRGSGSMLPNSFAKELGCNPDDKINLETEFVPITLTWSLSSVQGATIGSLKSVVESLQGNVGDYVFIIGSEPYVSFKLLKLSDLQKTTSGVCQLSLMVGGECTNNEEIAIFNIATALEIPTSSNKQLILAEARNSLNLRGEDKLASLIPEEKMSFDDYLKNMGELIK